MERRDRLRMIMEKLDADGQLEKLMKAHEEEEAAAPFATEEVEGETLQYPFYTEGSKSLLEVRVEISNYSIMRVASQLYRAKRKTAKFHLSMGNKIQKDTIARFFKVAGCI